MPRACSHSISLGTMSRAASDPGLEMTPAVLMMGIEEELPVSFRAEDGAVHDLRFESEVAHRLDHPPAGRLMQFGVANNAALAHLALSDFKLRFDPYNHLPAGLEQRRRGRQNQRHGDEADVAGDESGLLADPIERELTGVDALVEDDARVGAERP